MSHQSPPGIEFIFTSDVPSSVNEEECRELARLAQGKEVLEMGSYYGRSTIALASTAKMVWAVDWHQGDAHVGKADTYEDFVDNLVLYGVLRKVRIFVGRFEDIVPRLGREFDLVFVDGQHSEKDILRDGPLALGAVRSGGKVAFHDYGSIFWPIKKYVDSLDKPTRVVRTLAIVDV